ncbi:GTPase-activating protein gyp7-like [Ananas comosus]|uniref:GTPase-activating protein gyp7-like n=1 Tax=Ananas comosus TaxID=4615 RepID=A0A6P5FFZ7_ANACO|nr:GTPase-activating protein gyp7-like [Ananas comosus]
MMCAWAARVERAVGSILARVAGGDAGIWGPAGGRWHAGVAVGVTAAAGLALAAAIVVSSRRGSLRSPWSRRRRKGALTKQQWRSLFTPEGKLVDGGVRFLKIVRSGGIDPSIRAEVWPFLLGVYNLDTSEADRKEIRAKKRKEYIKLRKECQRASTISKEGGKELQESAEANQAACHRSSESSESVGLEVLVNPENSNDDNTELQNLDVPNTSKIEEEERSGITQVDESVEERESDSRSDCRSSDEEPESIPTYSSMEGNTEHSTDLTNLNAPKANVRQSCRTAEDFGTWQRIIRLDAIRANAEWVAYSPVQAAVSKDIAIKSALAVGLKDYDHLEPCRIYHAARLVAVLEAYAVYDPEIGYCQGMSDLLSPMLAVMEEDYEAFWCFVGFMRKARHNFRLDEVGIRRQLNIVSKIIKFKDPHFYRHLEKLQAEDCFFVYRMVVVMFRRELSFDQTLCLWEVVWADQAANRAGIGKSTWGRMRMGPPPTDDLLLYAIAASVLQKRKLIIERYSSMDEIIRECNNMAGQLDVWKLLDDAHNLVANLHDKIE